MISMYSCNIHANKENTVALQKQGNTQELSDGCLVLLDNNIFLPDPLWTGDKKIGVDAFSSRN